MHFIKKKVAHLFIIFILSNQTFSQTTINNNYLQVEGISSFHGSGDLEGFAYSIDYIKKQNNYFFWTIGIGGSVHDGVFPLFFTGDNGNLVDGSVRYTTAGLQLQSAFNIGLHLTKKLQVGIGAGPILRYQSSSNTAVVHVLYPAGTGLPYPVLILDNVEPHRTFSIGGRGCVFVSVSVKKYMVKPSWSLQTDSNGDMLSGFGLGIGRSFNW
jgi:hypothetical protein